MSAAQKPEPGNAVATVESSAEKPAISYALRTRTAEILATPEARGMIAPFIPRGVDYEHVLLEVHRCATNNAEILDCTPASIIQAVGQAVETGLVIGKTIHLVPVNTKISKRGQPDAWEKRLQAWTDYKGDIELVVWSGAARFVDAQAVYEGDFFDWQLGDTPYVKHRPPLDAAKRGKMIAFYSVAFLNGTGTLKKIVVMSLADVEKIRAKSKQWNPEKVKECPEWYGIKTAVHRNCKILPKNRRLASVIAMMDAREAHEGGEELVLELDPAQRIDGVASAPTIASSSATREFKGDAPAPAVTDARSSAAQFPLPFGRDSKGKPIGELPEQTLLDAYGWAKEQTDPEKQYPAFIAAAEELLEERRIAKDGAA